MADEFPPTVAVLRSGGETLRGHAGPLAYEPTPCQALVVDGTQGCTVRATWRVAMADGSADWLVCMPHLGDTIMLLDENYAQPVVVSRA